MGINYISIKTNILKYEIRLFDMNPGYLILQGVTAILEIKPQTYHEISQLGGPGPQARLS